jgi:hypothetical protein
MVVAYAVIALELTELTVLPERSIYMLCVIVSVRSGMALNGGIW